MQNFQLGRDSHMGGYKNKRIKRPQNPKPLLHSIHNYTFNKKKLTAAVFRCNASLFFDLITPYKKSSRHLNLC